MDRFFQAAHKVPVLTIFKGITADQLGKSLGVSRSTTRRYLEYLVAKGEATTE